jgi:TonB family protein
MPMKRAAVFSSVLHVVGPIALVAFMLFVLRMPLWDWLKPKTSSSDLTFVLVNDTNTPPPKQAQFRGNANQHAGGKRNPKKPVKPADANPTGGSGKLTVHKPTLPRLSKVSSEAPIKPVTQTTPTEAKDQAAKPTIETPGKPEAVAEVAQKVEPDQTSGGSLSGSLDGLAPAAGGSGMGASTGAGSGEGAQGNAQGGGGAPGVDVMADADFGPFMAELEKRIKKHWVPPRGSDSRKVMLLFYLARDGKLVKIETKKTSGDEETDRAAMAAVQQSTPFMPFPPEVKEDVLPIEFTFDYNVLNPKKTKRGLRW